MKVYFVASGGRRNSIQFSFYIHTNPLRNATWQVAVLLIVYSIEKVEKSDFVDDQCLHCDVCVAKNSTRRMGRNLKIHHTIVEKFLMIFSGLVVIHNNECICLGNFAVFPGTQTWIRNYGRDFLLLNIIGCKDFGFGARKICGLRDIGLMGKPQCDRHLHMCSNNKHMRKKIVEKTLCVAITMIFI